MTNLVVGIPHIAICQVAGGLNRTKHPYGSICQVAGGLNRTKHPYDSICQVAGGLNRTKHPYGSILSAVLPHFMLVKFFNNLKKTTVIGWTIPHGLTEMAFIYHMVWSLPSCFRWTRLCVIGWTIPPGSTRIERYPVAWNLSPCCFIFFTQYSRQYAMYTVWWSQIHGYISSYTSGILLSWKKKNQCIFSYQRVNTCDRHLYTS